MKNFERNLVVTIFSFQMHAIIINVALKMLIPDYIKHAVASVCSV